MNIHFLNSQLAARVLLLLALFFIGFGTSTLAQEEPTPVFGPRVVSYIQSPEQRFTVTDQSISVIGTVIVDPSIVQYWKVEIRGTAGRSFIGNDLWDRTLAFDWVTIGETRTDTVVDGELARLPHWPGMSPGNWLVRLVVVGHDDTFVVPELVVPFTVRVPETTVYAEVTYPAPGQIITDSNSVLGTILLDQWETEYRIELLGGAFTTWTTVDTHPNNTANPTRIQNGSLGSLPPLAELTPGEYRLRIVFVGWDGQYRREPYEVEFAVGTNRVSNLAEIAVTSPRISSNRITISEGTSLVGTVIVPQGAQYYKVEIKDDIRDAATQQPRFTDWTTLGSTHADSVSNGPIEFIAGPPAISPGTYRLRIVVIGADGSFSGEPLEISLVVREP